MGLGDAQPKIMRFRLSSYSQGRKKDLSDPRNARRDARPSALASELTLRSSFTPAGPYSPCEQLINTLLLDQLV